MTRQLGSTKVECSHGKQNALGLSAGRGLIICLLHKVSQNGDCLTQIYPGVLAGQDGPIDNMSYVAI